MTEMLTEAHAVDKLALVDFAASRALFCISTPIPRYNHRSKTFRRSQVLFLAIERLAPDPLDVIKLPRDRTTVLKREIQL